MSIRITPSSKDVIARIRGMKKLTREAVRAASFTNGHGLIKATSQQILAKPKGGKVYVRRDAAGRRRRHRASAPGETHANMSGRLRRSLSFKIHGISSIEFGYGVSSGDAPDYAQFVEDGTSRMAARPSLFNGIKSQRRNIQNNFQREIDKRLRGRF